MKNIFLHIGKHKTGSTSIQHYLSNNHSFFQEMGFHIITTDMTSKNIPIANRTNLAEVAHLVIRQDLKTPVRLRRNSFQEGFFNRLKEINQINRQLQAIKSENIIMSAEAFSFIRTRSEMFLLHFMLRGFTIIPIVYLRDKESWLESWYTQLIPLRKKLDLIDLPSEGIFDFSSDSWLVDDEAILRVFGEKTIAISYDRCLKEKASVIPSFLDALGLSVVDCPEWKDIWQNNSRNKEKTMFE